MTRDTSVTGTRMAVPVNGASLSANPAVVAAEADVDGSGLRRCARLDRAHRLRAWVADGKQIVVIIPSTRREGFAMTLAMGADS